MSGMLTIFKSVWERRSTEAHKAAGTNVRAMGTNVRAPKRVRPPEPLQRPADISPEDWAEVLARPVCTLTSAELARNDKVFAAALEKAAREVESTPPPAPWSPWPWKAGPSQEELRLRENSNPFPRYFK
jgi:hypothetical protein